MAARDVGTTVEDVLPNRLEGMREPRAVGGDNGHIPLTIKAVGRAVVLKASPRGRRRRSDRSPSGRGPWRCGGMLLGEVVVAVVPAGAEEQAVVTHDPAVLALVAKLVVRVGEDVGDPAAGVDCQRVGGVVVAGHIDTGAVQTAAQPTGAVGASAVHDADAVDAVDEEVPLAVDALRGVVVLDRRFAAEDAVQL